MVLAFLSAKLFFGLAVAFGLGSGDPNDGMTADEMKTLGQRLRVGFWADITFGLRNYSVGRDRRVASRMEILAIEHVELGANRVDDAALIAGNVNGNENESGDEDEEVLSLDFGFESKETDAPEEDEQGDVKDEDETNAFSVLPDTNDNGIASVASAVDDVLNAETAAQSASSERSGSAVELSSGMASASASASANGFEPSESASQFVSGYMKSGEPEELLDVDDSKNVSDLNSSVIVQTDGAGDSIGNVYPSLGFDGKSLLFGDIPSYGEVMASKDEELNEIALSFAKKVKKEKKTGVAGLVFEATGSGATASGMTMDVDGIEIANAVEGVDEVPRRRRSTRNKRVASKSVAVKERHSSRKKQKTEKRRK